VTGMDITIQASFRPHDDPDAGNLIRIRELR
jgi:hypothetical protein